MRGVGEGSLLNVKALRVIPVTKRNGTLPWGKRLRALSQLVGFRVLFSCVQMMQVLPPFPMQSQGSGVALG